MRTLMAASLLLLASCLEDAPDVELVPLIGECFADEDCESGACGMFGFCTVVDCDSGDCPAGTMCGAPYLGEEDECHVPCEINGPSCDSLGMEDASCRSVQPGASWDTTQCGYDHSCTVVEDCVDRSPLEASCVDGACAYS